MVACQIKTLSTHSTLFLDILGEYLSFYMIIMTIKSMPSHQHGSLGLFGTIKKYKSTSIAPKILFGMLAIRLAGRQVVSMGSITSKCRPLQVVAVAD